MSTKKVPAVKTPEVDNDWTIIASSEGKSVYGHRLNTLASLMDDLINAGKFTKAQIEQKISEHPFDGGKKTLGRAKQALKAHIAYLPGNKNVVVKQNAQGVIKGFAQPKAAVK
mgnify:CR=1 FL=1